jgi:hypothetical protein
MGRAARYVGKFDDKSKLCLAKEDDPRANGSLAVARLAV